MGSSPSPLVVDSNYIYRADADCYSGRAELDGQNVDDAFIAINKSVPPTRRSTRAGTKQVLRNLRMLGLASVHWGARSVVDRSGSLRAVDNTWLRDAIFELGPHVRYVAFGADRTSSSCSARASRTPRTPARTSSRSCSSIQRYSRSLASAASSTAADCAGSSSATATSTRSSSLRRMATSPSVSSSAPTQLPWRIRSARLSRIEDEQLRPDRAAANDPQPQLAGLGAPTDG